MVEIGTVGAVLSSIKTAIEISKTLKESGSSLEKAEIELKFADLISALADTKIEVASIQEIILEKDRQIKELETSQALRVSMKWRDPVYSQLDDNGNESLFCQQCYDNKKTAIRLQTIDPGHWHCLTCKNSYFGKNYSSETVIVDTGNGSIWDA
ncbi:MAG: hypothetical protein V3V02_06275 [Rhizobiaceae bacterium]